MPPNTPNTPAKASPTSAEPTGSTWLDPATAPRDGTAFLGDFGWPWMSYTVWDAYDEHWCVAVIQASPMKDGPDNTYLETDTERPQDLKRWLPLPTLPPAPPLHQTK